MPKHAEQAERHAHRPLGAVDSAISPGGRRASPTPAMCMPMLISQKVSTGFDQNTSASRGEPGHHRLMKSPRLVIWRATSA